MMTTFHFELWKVSNSLPEYMVSDWGRIMRIPFESTMPNGGVRRYGGKPGIGQCANDEGRYILFFKGKTYKVAKLVCEAFNGPRPFPEAVCMHIDENFHNNRADNLKWGTQKENLNAKGFLAYCRGRVGENSSIVKGRRRMGSEQS